MTARISEPFKTQGGHTQFDNDVLDYIMPSLTPSEWMVLSFIIRKTKGWHKESDGIAYSQFIKGTGIASNSTIKKCLDSLAEKEFVLIGTTGHMADCHHYMLNKNYSFRVTETVERPVTFSVERPVTKTVDTKESLKKEKERSPSPSIAAYENTFGPITYRASEILQDDIATYGETAVVEAIGKAKERRARAYAYVESILRNKSDETAAKQSGEELWQEVFKYQQHHVPFKELSPTAQTAVRGIGGESVLRSVQLGFESDQLKKRIMSYAQ